MSLYWPETLSGTAPSHVIVALILLVVLFVVRYYQKRQCFANIPPGPKPWPVVGNFGGFLIPPPLRRGPDRQQSKNPVCLLTELAELHGSVYSLFVGSQLVVVLNDYEVVRDALSNHPDVFSDRPDIPTITIMTKRKGKTHSLAISTMYKGRNRSDLPFGHTDKCSSYCNLM